MDVQYDFEKKIVTIDGINYKFVVTYTSNCDGCFFNTYKAPCWKVECTIDNVEYILIPEEI